MKLGGFLILVVGVLIGALSNQLVDAVQYPLGSAVERISPGDHIPEQDIEVYQDRVIIKLDGAKWATFADTNSMDPTFDRGNNALQVVPQSPDQIGVGDIISYRRGENIIIHRVIEKGIDEQGWYFIAKGDNNPAADTGKVRFEDITRLTVAVIY